MSPRRVSVALALLLVAVGAGLGLWAAWIPAKAVLAQVLLHRAWERTMAGEAEVKPWPWADTWPVARLQVAGSDRDLIVLAGGSGRTLAFGPGHVTGSPLPGRPGTAIIGGHRDTHFAFLRDLAPGARLLLTDAGGAQQAFEVRDRGVVDSRNDVIPTEGTTPRIALVTCWPFDAPVPGGPLRWLVWAEAVAPFQTARGGAI